MARFGTQCGRFGADDTRLVWYVLGAYSLGLLATTASRLLQSSFYAAGDARTPAAVAAARVTVAGVVGVVLMFQLDRVVLDGSGLTGLDAVGDLPAPLRPLSESARSDAGGLRLGAMGLALGSAAGAWLELALLRRRHRSIAGQLRMSGG